MNIHCIAYLVVVLVFTHSGTKWPELCALMRITTVVSVLLRECSAASAAELDTRAAHSLSNNQPDVKCWTKIEEEVERCEG